MSINLEVLKKARWKCSGNLDYCLCCSTKLIIMCYLAKSVNQVILRGVYFSKTCLIRDKVATLRV